MNLVLNYKPNLEYKFLINLLYSWLHYENQV